MILSPQTLIEAHLASTPSLQHVSEAATGWGIWFTLMIVMWLASWKPK